MKRIAAATLAFFLSTSVSHAGLKTIGSRDTLQFDPTDFPPAMKAKYEVVKTKCVGCHSLERLVVAVNTGVAPITGQVFTAKSVVTGFGCKPKKDRACLTKQEIRSALDLTNYLLKEAARR